MVLLFLRDWRSALVVVLNIPLAIMASIVGLWICRADDQPDDARRPGAGGRHSRRRSDRRNREHPHAVAANRFDRLGGAARQCANGGSSVAGHALHSGGVRAVVLHGRRGPRTVRAAVAGGRLRDDRFVHPVQHVRAGGVRLAAADITQWHISETDNDSSTSLHANHLRRVYSPPGQHSVAAALDLCVPFYCRAARGDAALACPRDHGWASRSSRRSTPASSDCACGPPTARTSTRTEAIALQVLERFVKTGRAGERRLTLGYVGTIPPSFPDQCRLSVVARPGRSDPADCAEAAVSGISTEAMKEELRRHSPQQLPDVRFSFEPADIVSEVMSFGSATPIEIAVRGGSIAENRDFLNEVQSRLATIARPARHADRRSRSTIRRST